MSSAGLRSFNSFPWEYGVAMPVTLCVPVGSGSPEKLAVADV